MLAKKTGSPIIPIVHIGSEKTFDKGSWVLKGRAHIHIRVLDEIPALLVSEMEVSEIIALVRSRMEEGIALLEKEKKA